MTTDGPILYSERIRAVLRDRPDYYTQDARWFASARHWTGMAAVYDADGAILSLPRTYRFGHHCTWVRQTSNVHAARAYLDTISVGKAGVWAGMLVYDATDLSIGAGAAHIRERLRDDPVFDGADLARRDRAHAADLLRLTFDVPEHVAEALVTVLQSTGTALCPECAVWPIDALREAAECQPCARCENWIHTSKQEPVHYRCAELYDCPDCNCVAVMTDTHRQRGTLVTTSDIRAAITACTFCTPRDAQGLTADQRRFPHTP